jgi:polysaccharide biosynthesis transport protein
MDLRHYLRIVRGHWLLVLSIVVLCTVAAALLAWSRTPIYEARTQLFVATGGVPADLSETYQGGLFAQQRVRSYAQIVDSPAVARRVIGRLGLDTTPEELGRKISAEAPVDTVLLNVTVRDPSADRAQAIANAVGEEFRGFADDLESPGGATNSPVGVTVTRPAELPESPSSPQYSVYLAFGILFGLVLGIGAAVLRDALDDRISGVGDVAAATDSPVIGVIADDPQAGRRPLVVAKDPISLQAEAYRRLRTNLRPSVDQGLRSYVVSSAVESEGKTLVAANLGIAFAEAGYRVTLVDADLRRPKLAEVFGLPPSPGLTNVMVDGAPLETALTTWQEAPTLEILTSGSPVPNPGELLGSEQFAAVLRRLTDRGDVVFLDAPALLHVADASLLAATASGVILVAQARSTRRDELETATQLLRGAGEQVFGVVLNRSPVRGSWPFRRPDATVGKVASLPRLASPPANAPVEGSVRLEDSSRSRTAGATDGS